MINFIHGLLYAIAILVLLREFFQTTQLPDMLGELLIFHDCDIISAKNH